MFGVSGLCYESLLRRRVGIGVTAACYALWSAIWIAAHIAGAAAVGMALGSIGARVPMSERESDLFLIALLAAVLHLSGFLTLPQPRIERQVSRRWMHEWPLLATAAGYGLQLGAAVLTRVTHFSTWIALLAALLTRDQWSGALLFGCYGLSRSLPPVLAGPSAVDPEQSFRLAVRFAAYDRLAGRAAQVFISGWALALLILRLRGVA